MAQVVVGQVEFADALVLTGPAGDDVLTAVLDRVACGTPRFELSTLDVPRLLAVPVGRRFTPAFGPLLRGVPLEPAAGVSVVRFAARRPFHPMRLHDALDVLLDGVVRARGRVWAISQPSPRHVAGVGRRRVERRRGRSRPGRPPRPRGRSSGKGRCTR